MLLRCGFKQCYLYYYYYYLMSLDPNTVRCRFNVRRELFPPRKTHQPTNAGDRLPVHLHLPWMLPGPRINTQQAPVSPPNRNVPSRPSGALGKPEKLQTLGRTGG